MNPRSYFTRAQKTTIVYGILSIVLLITILQLWLLTATMNAYLGGESDIPVPAALVSLVCLGLNVGLLRYLFRLDRVTPHPPTPAAPHPPTPLSEYGEGGMRR